MMQSWVPFLGTKIRSFTFHSTSHIFPPRISHIIMADRQGNSVDGGDKVISWKISGKTSLIMSRLHKKWLKTVHFNCIMFSDSKKENRGNTFQKLSSSLTVITVSRFSLWVGGIPWVAVGGEGTVASNCDDNVGPTLCGIMFIELPFFSSLSSWQHQFC